MLDGGLSIGEGAFFGAFNYYTRRLTPLQTGAFSQGAYFNAYQWPAFARKTPLGIRHFADLHTTEALSFSPTISGDVCR